MGGQGARGNQGRTGRAATGAGDDTLIGAEKIKGLLGPIAHKMNIDCLAQFVQRCAMSEFNDPTPIATSEQFRSALLAARQRMTDVQLKMLQAHCRCTGRATSIDKLAEKLSLPNLSGARTAYSNYAHLIADELKYTPAAVSKKPIWLYAIAYGQPDATGKLDGGFEWILRPELVHALEAMKWA
jgi:hypothetical protein